MSWDEAISAALWPASLLAFLYYMMIASQAALDEDKKDE